MAAVSVQCPGCGKSLLAEASPLSQSVQCGNCGRTLTIVSSNVGTVKRMSDTELPVANLVAGRAIAQDKSAAPATIGRYRVVRKLGAGAMGVVWLAHDPQLDRDVAIKVLPASLAKDEDYLKRFFREARLAAKLHHPNTVTVHDVGEDGDLAYMVMELVEGGSMGDAVAAEKPMDWREATRAARDAACGLAAAHQLGLVHRDIKPENLMRTRNGVTKVADFGLARSQLTESRYTQQGMLMGTPAFMAPELWQGREADARSDLYALVLTYYYLLTGRLPFVAEHFMQVAHQHADAPLPDPRAAAPGLPDQVCRLLLLGAAKQPEDRYSDAAELAADLDGLLNLPPSSFTYGTRWEKMSSASSLKLSAGAKGWRKTSPPASTKSRILPRTIAGLAVAALVGALGVIVFMATDRGQVRIELSDPGANVEVKIDGKAFDIAGLRDPLQIRPGTHELNVASDRFQTFTRSFSVKRGETEVVRVALEPKPVVLEPKPKEVASLEKIVPKLATYRITLQPADALLTASGQGVTVSGEGAQRTIVVAEPDGKSRVLLVATKPQYKTLNREIEPKQGESSNLTLELEPWQAPKPIMATYHITLRPADAELTAGGKGVTVSGEGALRTVAVTEPDGQSKLLLVARKSGYKTLEKEIQPRQGEVSTLDLELAPKPVPPKLAEYAISIEPADARLAVSGNGVTVSGELAERKVTVAEPDGKSKVVLLVTKPGYRSVERRNFAAARRRGAIHFHARTAAASKAAGIDELDWHETRAGSDGTVSHGQPRSSGGHGLLF